MAQADRARDHDRLKAGAGAAALHLVLGYAFLVGLGFDLPAPPGEALKVFAVAGEPPPPPSVPDPVRNEAPEGAAAPPSLPPSPVVAPQPRIRLEVPPPVVASPVPAAGSDSTPGNAEVAGAGPGAGGEGTGPGSGGRGDGSGGGLARRAQRERGRLMNEDYPRAAKRARAEGVVDVRFTVGADGYVRDCAVTRSSGHGELDSTTCRLIEQRFRYRPATDPAGRPVAEVVDTSFEWMLRF